MNTLLDAPVDPSPRPGKSTALLLFATRVNSISIHLDTVDAALELMERQLKGGKNEGLSPAARLGLRHGRYRALDGKANQPTALTNKARRHNAEHALIALYSAFGEYSRNMLRAMYELKPLLVAGKSPGSLQFQEIARLGSFEAIADRIVDQVIRKLQGLRNSSKLISELLEGTALEVDTELLRRSLMYFEMRHLIVHGAGRMDQNFVARFSDLIRVPHQKGSRLQMSLGLARQALDTVGQLVHSIDAQLITRGFLPAAT